MYRLMLPVLALGLNLTLACAQVKPSGAGNPSIKKRITGVDKKKAALMAKKKDTIPLSRYKYYKIDEASNLTYINTSLNRDSVKQEKADKGDWDEFAETYAGLQKALQLNQFDNAKNYIDTGKDFIELKLLNQDFFPNTAKVCLRQLTFNIQILDQMLSKPLPEKADVQLLSSVMNNIDILINKYVATKGVILSIKNLLLPNVSIKIFDSNGAELKKAKCYFISFKTCRDIACRSCVPGLDPCDENNINAITSKPDGTFDCANPVKIKVDYGHYHFFVISNNKIRYYEQLHIDENSGSSENDNEIKINL